MSKKKQRIPVNSVGKLIKEAREKQGLSIEELAWKINKPKITKKLIKDWEKGQEFPDLNNIYLLAEHLNLNPNELLNKRLTIQDESIHEVNWAERRASERMLHITKLFVQVMIQFVGVILAILLGIYASHFIKLMTNTSDPTQEQIIVNVIDDGVKQFTSSGDYLNDTNNTNVNNTITNENIIK